MLTFTITVDCPGWMAQGAKEYIAMCLEKFGDTRVIEVREDKPAPSADQLKLKEGP